MEDMQGRLEKKLGVDPKSLREAYSAELSKRLCRDRDFHALADGCEQFEWLRGCSRRPLIAGTRP
jgi:hypothetical protein